MRSSTWSKGKLIIKGSRRKPNTSWLGSFCCYVCWFKTAVIITFIWDDNLCLLNYVLYHSLTDKMALVLKRRRIALYFQNVKLLKYVIAVCYFLVSLLTKNNSEWFIVLDRYIFCCCIIFINPYNVKYFTYFI